jgi:hypothetical protein
MYVYDGRNFKISGKYRSPLRVFVAIFAIQNVILHHEIFAKILLFLLHNLDYFLESFLELGTSLTL